MYNTSKRYLIAVLAFCTYASSLAVPESCIVLEKDKHQVILFGDRHTLDQPKICTEVDSLYHAALGVWIKNLADDKKEAHVVLELNPTEIPQLKMFIQKGVSLDTLSFLNIVAIQLNFKKGTVTFQAADTLRSGPLTHIPEIADCFQDDATPQSVKPLSDTEKQTALQYFGAVSVKDFLDAATKIKGELEQVIKKRFDNKAAAQTLAHLTQHLKELDAHIKKTNKMIAPYIKLGIKSSAVDFFSALQAHDSKALPKLRDECLVPIMGIVADIDLALQTLDTAEKNPLTVGYFGANHTAFATQLLQKMGYKIIHDFGATRTRSRFESDAGNITLIDPVGLYDLLNKVCAVAKPTTLRPDVQATQKIFALSSTVESGIATMDLITFLGYHMGAKKDAEQKKAATEKKKELHLCAACPKKDATQCCSRCKTTYYCSPACQTAHWKHHKTTCKATKETPKA